MEANRIRRPLPRGYPTNSLTLSRPWDGIGDWLFCLAVLKYVNRQRPDVECFVDFRALRVRAGLPPFVQQVFEDSDVRFSHGVGPAGTMVTADSLVYRKWPPDLYLESTVHHLNDQTGLDIKYEHGVYPRFRSGRARANGDGYVVMIGQGKRRERFRKEWGFANFSALAAHLARAGVTVIQIGKASDSRLPTAKKQVMGAHARDVVGILSGARAFIGIENGMMVLAGYLGVPQITIYDGASHPVRTNFDGQAKLVDRIEPREAAERTIQWLQTGNL